MASLYSNRGEKIFKSSLDNYFTSEYNAVVDNDLSIVHPYWVIKVMRWGNVMNIQYKKGVLELCVLSLLEKRDWYGYEISEYLSQKIDIADGTVYPLLRKLKSDGLVTTYLSEEIGGPPRKYYSLTKTGREAYASDRNDYLNFATVVASILED